MMISGVRFANASNMSVGREIPKTANTNAWYRAPKLNTANCTFLFLMKERKFIACCLLVIRFATESSSQECDSVRPLNGAKCRLAVARAWIGGRPGPKYVASVLPGYLRRHH